MRSHYDFICIVSNDLSTENRMKRCCKVLSDEGKTVLLAGRILKHSPPISNENFEQLRIKFLVNSGPLFYIELIVRFTLLLKKVNFSNLICVDLDTAFVSLFLSKKNRRFIVDLHEYFEEVPELQGKLFKKKQKTLKSLIKA